MCLPTTYVPLGIPLVFSFLSSSIFVRSAHGCCSPGCHGRRWCAHSIWAWKQEPIDPRGDTLGVSPAPNHAFASQSTTPDREPSESEQMGWLRREEDERRATTVEHLTLLVAWFFLFSSLLSIFFLLTFERYPQLRDL